MLEVACAIIVSNHKILCAQRGRNMKHPMKWEFPGGKLENYEKPEVCIAREIKEEFSISVKVINPLSPVFYPQGEEPSLKLYPFICTVISGVPIPMEHHQYQWLDINQLKELDWLEADIEIVRTLETNPGIINSI